MFAPATNPVLETQASPRGAVHYEFFSDAVTCSHRFAVVIKNMAGIELIRDPDGTLIVRQTEHEVSHYYLHTNPETDWLPVGTAVAEICIDDEQIIKIPITVLEGTFKLRRRRRVQPLGVPPVISALLIWAYAAIAWAVAQRDAKRWEDNQRANTQIKAPATPIPFTPTNPAHYVQHRVNDFTESYANQAAQRATCRYS